MIFILDSIVKYTKHNITNCGIEYKDESTKPKQGNVLSNPSMFKRFNEIYPSKDKDVKGDQCRDLIYAYCSKDTRVNADNILEDLGKSLLDLDRVCLKELIITENIPILRYIYKVLRQEDRKHQYSKLCHSYNIGSLQKLNHQLGRLSKNVYQHFDRVEQEYQEEFAALDIILEQIKELDDVHTFLNPNSENKYTEHKRKSVWPNQRPNWRKILFNLRPIDIIILNGNISLFESTFGSYLEEYNCSSSSPPRNFSEMPLEVFYRYFGLSLIPEHSENERRQSTIFEIVMETHG